MERFEIQEAQNEQIEKMHIEQIEDGVVLEYSAFCPDEVAEENEAENLLFGQMNAEIPIEEITSVQLCGPDEGLRAAEVVSETALDEGILPPECGTSMRDLERILASEGYVIEEITGATLSDITEVLESEGYAICFVQEAALTGNGEGVVVSGWGNSPVVVRGLDLRDPEKPMVSLVRINQTGGGMCCELKAFLKAWSYSDNRCILLYRE